jgi:hypothetical protein
MVCVLRKGKENNGGQRGYTGKTRNMHRVRSTTGEKKENEMIVIGKFIGPTRTHHPHASIIGKEA